MKVDVVIPAYKPGEKFVKLIKRLAEQTIVPEKIIVINTEEQFFAKDILEQIGQKASSLLELHHISGREFDHAATRNAGVSYSSSPIVVLMTDDAVPADPYLIEALVSPFADPEVGAVYARQLPNEDAGIAERFSRAFNYPDRSRKKTIADLEELGVKTFFCSNVCAAYRRSCLDTYGGFMAPAVFNEDMVFAATLMDHALAIYYAADAKVYHSHSYTNRQQLHRNFDLAVSQAMHPEVFERVRSESEGLKFVSKAFRYFWKQKRPLAVIPFAITTVYKYAGYRLGKRYRRLSRERILKLTMNPVFFEHMWKEDQKLR